MENDAQNITGAEELVQATISVEHLDDPATQSDVMAAVRALDGVRSVNLVEGKLHICYDPLRITEKKLEAAIGRSGHRPEGGEVERESPFADLEE